MTFRPEGIGGIAYGFGCDYSTSRNVTKALTKASGRNCTAMGRGKGDTPVDLDWLLSVGLGVVVNDLKNCVRKVEAISNLVCKSDKLVRVENAPNRLLALSTDDLQEKSEVYWAKSQSRHIGKDLFSQISLLVKELAHNWDGEVHADLKKCFSLTIDTGDSPSAVLEEYLSTHGEFSNIEWRVRYIYGAPSRVVRPTAVPFSRAVSRQATVALEHLEILAILYADSWRHLVGSKADTELNAPSIKELPKSIFGTNLDDGNENAGSFQGEPAPTRDQDHCVTQDTSNLENGREKEKTQARSRGGAGQSSTPKGKLIDDKFEHRHRSGSFQFAAA